MSPTQFCSQGTAWGHCRVAGKVPTGLWASTIPWPVTSPRSALPGTPSFNTHAAARVHLRLHPPGNGGQRGPAAAQRVSVQWQEGTVGWRPPGDSLACSGDTRGPLCQGRAGAGLVAELTERSSDLLPTQSSICFISVVNSG